MQKFVAFIFILLLVAVTIPSFSQSLILSNSANYIYCDAYALQTPVDEEKTLERLTIYLVKPYQTDYEKIRSIYVWIVNNISYDYRLASSDKRKRVPPKTIITNRKAICSGYADLFAAMSRLAGIESKVVVGYSRQYNFSQKRPFTWSGHAWNAVKLHGEWHLLDATWESKHYGESGKQIESNYFLIDPKDFVVDHLPEDPMWQLLTCPISLTNFTQSAQTIKDMLSRKDTCFYYADTIAALHQLLIPDQELKTARKSYQFNSSNHTSIGVALSNYGTYLVKSNTSNTKKSADFRIAKEKEALEYFMQALRHLRQTYKKDYIKNCKKSIKLSRMKIRKLKRYKRDL